VSYSDPAEHVEIKASYACLETIQEDPFLLGRFAPGSRLVSGHNQGGAKGLKPPLAMPKLRNKIKYLIVLIFFVSR